MNMVEQSLNEKVVSVFGDSDTVVDKKLAALSDQFKKLPRFVVDYLISQLVDPSNPAEGLDRIDVIMRENYVESDQKELIKSKIRQNGSHKLLGQIRCRYDQAKDEYWADISALGE